MKAAKALLLVPPNAIKSGGVEKIEKECGMRVVECENLGAPMLFTAPEAFETEIETLEPRTAPNSTAGFLD